MSTTAIDHCFHLNCLINNISISSSVDHAVLRNNGFLKPNPYVEILVDGKSVRKTDTLKNTNHPRWDQELTILVTPVSVLQFRVLDHSSFRKDTVLGEKTAFVAELLRKQRESRTENYILYMYLTKASSATVPGETSPDGTRATNSEMLVVIKGLVRMLEGGTQEGGASSVVTVNGLVSPPPSVVVGGHGTNGDVVRIRGRISGGGEEYEGGSGVGAYGSSNQVTGNSSVGAIKRNSGVVNWSGGAVEMQGAVNGTGSGGGVVGDPKLLQRATVVQVSDKG